MFARIPRLSSVASRLLRLFLPITLAVSLLAPALTVRPLAAAPRAHIIYAKPDGAFDASGESWATARDLSAAMRDAVAGDEIWAKQGVYIPLTLALIFAFQAKSGVAIYGGFAGTESRREQRNPAKHVSVLSGDLGGDDTHKDAAGVISTPDDIVDGNLPHVVYGDDTDSSAVLDGFTITGGDASDTGTVPCTGCGGGLTMVNGNATLANLIFSGNKARIGGGGLYLFNSSPTLAHVTFTGNQADANGGGMYLGNSNPQMTQIVFSYNRTDDSGGGMYLDSSSPQMNQITFGHNQADGYGGGIYLDSSSPQMNQITFIGNQAVGRGGGMFNYAGSSPTLMNAVFSGNRADRGGGMLSTGSSPTLINVVFSGNFADSGGAIAAGVGHLVLTNVTFSGNQATVAGAIFGADSTIDLTNTIVWDNGGQAIDGGAIYNYDHSLVDGEYPAGAGNLDGTNNDNSPYFVHSVNCGVNGCTDDPDPAKPDDESADDDYGDLRPQRFSSVVDAGDNKADLDGDGPGKATIVSIPTDLAGQPRLLAVKRLPATVDLGAYEHANAAPNAAAGDPYTSAEGSSLALNGAGSSDDIDIVTYAWDCTNNGSIDASAALPTGSHCTYANDGTFSLRLTVTDNVSATDTATTTVTVTNVAPTYSPAPTQSTLAGSAKLFTLGSFADPGAEGSWPVTVDWGDSSSSSQFSAGAVGTLSSKSHTYAAAGSYSVVVTVNDGKASNDGSFAVTVNPLPPGAPKVTAPADQTATAGIEQSFALGSFSDPGSSGPWQASVNWGDNSTLTQFNAASAGALPAKSHAYPATDTYDVVVTVSDGVLSAGASFQISASAQDNTGSVSGVVFADGNANGTQEKDEAGVAGAVLTLKTGSEASAAATELTRTTTSDSSGHYRFDNVPAGDYTLALTAPAGFATAGTSQVALSVQVGKTTTAPTFPLKADEGGSSGSLFLPTVRRP